MKVLIVDDSPTNLRLLRAMLEGENLEVIEAPDGEKALEILRQEKADAIISDILMPHMDGYRLCHEVRKSEIWREMPFIFHTATYTSSGDEKLCYDLGGDIYLRKPATAVELMSALKEAAHPSHKRPDRREVLPPESDVMKQYSERLVSKLEQKNEELEQARAALERANRDLDLRVQQRTAELVQANQELESFSHSVSHDLRAPLRHISGYIDILLRDCAGKLDAENLKYLQTVHASARTMTALIDALLQLSKVARFHLNRRPVDLSALAAEALAELRLGDPNRKAQIEIAPALEANGDPILLRIVLTNLLGNAWKYTRHQTETRIEFGKAVEPTEVNFFVRDNGAGFDMAYAGKLFKAFQRLHRDDEFEGVGVGLATVHRIIRRHNGKIRAQGAVGQGATFFFTLGGDGSPLADSFINN